MGAVAEGADTYHYLTAVPRSGTAPRWLLLVGMGFYNGLCIVLW